MDAFYVKSIAAWVPHKLIANHVPKCPKCSSSKSVDLTKCRWINQPKLLYGVSRHRYLDTVMYPCRSCSSFFTGYDETSIKLDASLYLGYFNFYLGPRYAVDEELHRHIVLSASLQSTAVIAQTIKNFAYEAYYSDYQQYLTCVGVNKIQPPKKKRTVHAMATQAAQGMPDNPELARLLRRKQRCKEDLQRANDNYLRASERAEGDIEFHHLLDSKQNHNVTGDLNVMEGLGPVKIGKLRANQIFSARQLLLADSSDYPAISHLIPRWVTIVNKHYRKLKERATYFKNCLTAAEEALESAEDEYEEKQQELYPDGPPDPPDTNVTEEEEPPWVPPLFSKFNDRKGYNGRVASKHIIDSVVTSVFNRRKTFIEAKLMGITAAVLKIDFNYKLAKKIRVWTKQGQSFAPFKCIVTIQNEDGLNIFWKALKHSESFSEIEADLIRLRFRLDRNDLLKRKAEFEELKVAAEETGIEFEDDEPPTEDHAVKVVWVDNCCNVNRILQRCFPGAEILLDVFHWLKRWNKVLYDPGSLQAGVFRALMCRALFMVDDEEYARAKTIAVKELEKKGVTGRQPTVYEVKKHARASIPSPEILRDNVEGVLRYIQAKDANTESELSMRRDEDESPKPDRFLKSGSVTRALIVEQFGHIDNGCLSDPPVHIVNIFRHNPKTGKTYVARGTNTNERDNLDLATKILTATHIGKHPGFVLIARRSIIL